MLHGSVGSARVVILYVDKGGICSLLKQPSRCERIQKTSCVMEGGSHTIFLCALFIFSAEGKVSAYMC